ncbi:MAG TPA: hypothetical protein DEF45_24825 [Rhodopirellula sp.]|nr:hypothetical protein [Rhodopirellula sp.]
MKMKIKCPACNTVLNIPAEAAGKIVKCPCGKQLRAPATAVGPAAVKSPTSEPAPTGAKAASGLDSSSSGSVESNAFDDLPGATSTAAPNPFSQTSPYAPPGPGSSGNPAGPQRVAPGAASNQNHPVAVVSLVFGILSLTLGCCCWLHIPLGLTAVVTGGFGIHFGNQGRGGKGMAIAGLIMGIISLIVYTILAIIGVAAQFANMPNGPFNQ